MADPNWELLGEIKVPANPESGHWTLAHDYVDSPCRLRFVVEDEIDVAGQANRHKNRWKYQEKDWTANGDPRAPINPANCLLPEAPPGALIAKIGGSIAGRADAPRYIVGSRCVIEVAESTKGPLYLTMNADPMSSQERKGVLVLKVFRSR